jgi:hypothetical protein
MLSRLIEACKCAKAEFCHCFPVVSQLVFLGNIEPLIMQEVLGFIGRSAEI